MARMHAPMAWRGMHACNRCARTIMNVSDEPRKVMSTKGAKLVSRTPPNSSIHRKSAERPRNEPGSGRGWGAARRGRQREQTCQLSLPAVRSRRRRGTAWGGAQCTCRRVRRGGQALRRPVRPSPPLSGPLRPFPPPLATHPLQGTCST